MNLLKEDRAQSLVVVAVFMGLVGVGFLAFALDVGSLFRAKRMAQAAADAAAVAAAEEVSVGNTMSNEQAMANAVAKLNGFDPTASTNPATVTLSVPSTGNFRGTGYVQATVSQPIVTTFLSGFPGNGGATPVTATAIAGGQASPTCICLEGTTQDDLAMSNASKVVASNCGIVVDSNASNAVSVVGSASLSGTSLGTVSSTWNNSGNINNGGSISSSTTIVQGITSSCAPTMPAVPSYSSCVANPGGGSSNFTAGPASYTGTVCYNGLTIGANGTTPTLNPGIYVIASGSLHFESGNGSVSNLGGQGVFFYLTGTASLKIDNGANVNLVSGGATESGGGTAPNIGSYNGILVYQDSSDTSTMSIAGGASTYLNGALYAPSAVMSFGGGSATTIQGGLVASQIQASGGGTLTATVGSVSEGSLTITSPRLVQ